MVKAVLFDMDGTVLDTEPVYKRAWKSAFERAGHEFSDMVFNKCVGLPVPLIKKCVNEHYCDPELFGVTFPMAASWAHNYKKANGIPVKSGFGELSEFLEKKGIKSIIVTSTSHHPAVEDLTRSGIINRFAGVVGGDDIANGKPAPDPYIKAAELAGAPLNDCIAVEDSVNGIRSAVAAGVRCVYIKDFLDIPKEVERMIFKRVNRLDEIIGIIEGLA